MSRKSRKLAKAARERDSVDTPGARSRDLSTQAIQQPRQNPSAGIDQGNGSDWMGPGNPMRPIAPPEVEGRTWDFPVGYNLQTAPRAYESVSFAELRALADGYDILRLVIETRKDQMEKLNWSIKSRVLANGDPATSDSDPLIQEITDFFAVPDGKNDWGVWLRGLLEDMFVIDAASIYCERTRGGKLLKLKQIDGALIKPVIDNWGDTPEPPIVAYQEKLKGFPAVDYTTDDLIYLPRNKRIDKVYGFSHVQQIVLTVSIGLSRAIFQKGYYTEGNLPEGLCGTPDDWTPDQIGKFQNAWDAMLAGNLAIRRRIKFVPGGVAKTFVPLKEPELTGKMDEWLARQVCFCFSVSPQPFVSMMNRATAQTAHDAAIDEGLAPVMNWTKRLIDRIIRKEWPSAKLEFEWNDDREVDRDKQMTTLIGAVTSGIKKINEARDDLGLHPDPDGDRLLVKTANGYVPIGQPVQPAPPSGAPPPGQAGKPGEQPNIKPAEAQAAKAAGGFPADRSARQIKKAQWWNRTAARHAHAPDASGAAGGE
jgi:hypothetical protein